MLHLAQNSFLTPTPTIPRAPSPGVTSSPENDQDTPTQSRPESLQKQGLSAWPGASANPRLPGLPPQLEHDCV